MIRCFLAVAMLAGMAGVAQEDNSFEAFFAEFAAKREGVEVLEANFEQKTVLPDEILTTEGSLLYAKPRRIVFRTEDPEQTILIDGRRVWEHEPDIKQMVSYDLADDPRMDVFFVAFDSDTERLRRVYDVGLLTTQDDPRGSRGIVVKPKLEDGEDALFREVNVYLRHGDLLPYRIRIVNDEESEVFIDVQELTVNGAPPPERTQIRLPEGTTIIENDEVVETVGPEGKGVPEALQFMPEPSGGAAEDREDTQVEVKTLEAPGEAP